MKLIPIEHSNNLHRDSDSNAVINTSKSEFESYIELKKGKLKEKTEIETLKNEVGELKDLMKLIIQKLDNNS